MQTFLTVVAVAVALLVALAVGLQVMVRVRAERLKGQPAPKVPGALGKRIAAGRRALVYFHSPGCGACRPFTPRLLALSKKNPAVHVIDVSQNLEVARAFGVMATPSAVEIDGGQIVLYQVGPLPPDLIARFSASNA